MAKIVNKGVATTHEKYDKFLPKWKRIRDVLAGQDAVHSAGPTYLPKLNKQTDQQYKSYVKRAAFYNASWRTVSALLGMMFRKPPESELPNSLDPYLEDVSMKGVPFDVFAEEYTLEWLSIGFCGVLTDHPPAVDTNGKELTLAEAETLGLRPTMQLYKAEAIRNWKFRTINNKHTLSMVVLGECVPVAEDEFSDIEQERFRVLDLDEAGQYRVRVFTQDKDGKYELIEGPIYPLLNNKPLNYIPFEADFDFCDPPLIDLIDANLNHYLVSADYYHALHFTALPTPVVSGYTPSVPEPGQAPEELYIGSETAWVFPDPNAKAEYLEFTGQGLTALEKALDRIENQMANLGAKMLASEKAGVEAFKTHAMRNAGENSILASIAIAVSLKLEKALKTFSAWASSPDSEISYELNRDYMPVVMDAQTLTALVAACQAGKLSDAELFDLLKRGDLIESDKTLEEHQGEIDATPLPAPIADPSKPKPGDKPADPKSAGE